MWRDRMLLDIELQRDFFSPGGACFERVHLQAARNVRRLLAWARRQRLGAISTMLRIRRGRIGPLAPVPHCIEGTNGEKRISGALLARHVDFGIRNTTDLPEDVLERHQQIIFEKRHTDIFRHARAERLLTRLAGGTFVVFGAGAAGGVVEAVIGLIARGFKVQLATDAILDLDSREAEFAWLRMLAKGAEPMTTDEILGAARSVRGGGRRRAITPFRCADRALTG
jgi:nicotinamidase-related amidase